MKWSTTAILIVFAAFVAAAHPQSEHVLLRPAHQVALLSSLQEEEGGKTRPKKAASEDRRLWVPLGRSTAAGLFSPGPSLIVLSLAACARRAPVLVPPSGGVEAVEGFGSASIAGVDAAIKGKFGFVFRRPGLGRVEAVDPIGRTAFLIVFRDGRAWFVLPGKKVYAEDARRRS